MKTELIRRTCDNKLEVDVAPSRVIEDTPLRMLAQAYKKSWRMKVFVNNERYADGAYDDFGRLYRPSISVLWHGKQGKVREETCYVFYHTPETAHVKCNTDIRQYIGLSQDDLPLELFEAAAAFADTRGRWGDGRPFSAFLDQQDAFNAVYVGWRRIRDRGGAREPRRGQS